MKSADYDLKSLDYGLKSTPYSKKKKAKSNDWLPSSRMLLIGMCRNWIAYMTDEMREAWGVPADQFTALKEKMRFFRDRYFKIPPLTDGDWAGTQELDPNAIYVGS